MSEQQQQGGILVVDDNPANLHLMAGVLREAGYPVRAAPGGTLALESVRARLPELILLDVRMPDMDGFEVCRRLKADPASRDIPVIFLSALQESQDKLRGFAAGAVDYITKPFVAEEVLVRVRSHLALRELQLQLERKVEIRTRALRTLSAGNQAVVHAETVDTLLERMCRAIVETGGYRAAWIGLDGGLEVSHGEIHRHPPARDELTPDGPCLITCCQDSPLWPADGGRAALMLPLSGKAGLLGRMVVFSGDSGTFGATHDIALLHELAGDLVYGLETLQARREQVRYREILERSLERTIESLAATIEVRDPYTAGHQRRTTIIAEAIGRELGLDQERLKGLHVAGTIHDIGKISVPVEILSKPGRLTTAEFELIKGHPATGYEIIQGIEFPWPVADIVRQHHERLDGSGYPEGLAGDAILFEARILAIADVVEAISSHRPYRAALGLDVALDELRQHRGSRYDPAAVDACLRLAEEGRLP